MNNKPYFEVETVYLKGNKRVEHLENLDKILIPFYCTFSFDGGNTSRLGLVDWDKGYFLQDHSEQFDVECCGGVVDKKDKLLDLIKEYNINTVKVKLIVFQ